MLERETPVESRLAKASLPSTTDRWRLDSSKQRTRAGRSRVIVVGTPSDLPRAVDHPALADGRFDVAATIGVDVEQEDGASLTNVLSSLIREQQPDAILVAGSIGSRAMRQIADLALVHGSELLALMPTEVLPEHEPFVVWHGDSPLVQLSHPSHRRWQDVAKRTIDIVGAGIGLIIAAPLLAILAIAIRLESPGSPVFRHERVGRKGRRFLCLKLRTMRCNAEDELRANAAMYAEYRRHHFKIPEDLDPRVTKLGRFLRQTSLDELPQLWNVLVGEMSLVGPRPVVEDELEMYCDDRDLILSIRPGITGAWAVSGRQTVGYPTRCNIELHYVREWTIAGDMRILMRTFQVVGD